MTRQEAMEIAAGIYSSKVTEIAAECIAESSMHESDKAVLSSRLRGLQRVYDQCRAAGFIDDNGAVRKVLGQPVLSGDGHILGVGGRVWFVGGLPEDGASDWAEIVSVSRDEVVFRPTQRVTWIGPSLCFSTSQAAISDNDARKESAQ